MSKVLDAISPDARALIVGELERRNPDLLSELKRSEAPTTAQSDAVVDVLTDALVKTFGPNWAPDAYGLAVERAIKAYLEAWPIYR
ncbi:hypothetical protein [Mycobacterium palustre]|uniref:hypothetical protein n=1 Tax=Mycobacterium palustre TaxID=153971 RepID=UPI000A155586|nr:hypothetical protein [Mycobacterium palustre]MCV7102393.1 hypothetical protein [Mycobacterium palustre]